MKTSVDDYETISSAQQAGRLEPEIWEGIDLPLPFPSWFDRPVSPSKLDPVLLRAKMRGEAVYADERGLL